ncbi:uncharacterized protein LOC124787749 isoform X2 [Schistocerca piceifrons]|uniref:uncharacterized protein LOC124787749 isoform X2 n=1 Tax=Schistocerca piceifrons TaxID=274613 RepID=UPI001F5F0573|nr:uncharacterized protein LOC124787749 isoform X2 [Schistocerca piceifrons]
MERSPDMSVPKAFAEAIVSSGSSCTIATRGVLKFDYSCHMKIPYPFLQFLKIVCSFVPGTVELCLKTVYCRVSLVFVY